MFKINDISSYPTYYSEPQIPQNLNAMGRSDDSVTAPRRSCCLIMACFPETRAPSSSPYIDGSIHPDYSDF